MPINKADKMVNINAWINATSNSIPPINIAKAIETGAIYKLLNTNTKQINESIKMCPAVMFANKRMAKAIGLVKIPKISTGTITIYIHQGTSGAKICFQ